LHKSALSAPIPTESTSSPGDAFRQLFLKSRDGRDSLLRGILSRGTIAVAVEERAATSHGSVSGTLIGALIIAVMTTGLVMLNVQLFWQYIVVGIIVILAVLIDQARIIAGRIETG
jgi:hypothetical protein